MRTDTDFNCNTNGKGYWSREQRAVRCLALDLEVHSPFDDEPAAPPFGELRVMFDTAGWNTSEHGLIYTDLQFMSELRRELFARGVTEAALYDFGYSEQGMQGDDYVSCDAGATFIAEFTAKYPKV